MFSLNRKTVSHFIPGYNKYDFNYSSCEKYFSPMIATKITAKMQFILHGF